MPHLSRKKPVYCAAADVPKYTFCTGGVYQPLCQIGISHQIPIWKFCWYLRPVHEACVSFSRGRRAKIDSRSLLICRAHLPPPDPYASHCQVASITACPCPHRSQPIVMGTFMPGACLYPTAPPSTRGCPHRPSHSLENRDKCSPSRQKDPSLAGSTRPLALPPDSPPPAPPLHRRPTRPIHHTLHSRRPANDTNCRRRRPKPISLSPPPPPSIPPADARAPRPAPRTRRRLGARAQKGLRAGRRSS